MKDGVASPAALMVIGFAVGIIWNTLDQLLRDAVRTWWNDRKDRRK